MLYDTAINILKKERDANQKEVDILRQCTTTEIGQIEPRLLMITDLNVAIKLLECYNV